MRLRSNYQTKDWDRFLLTLIVQSSILLPIIYVDVEYLLVPALQLLDIGTKKISQDDYVLATKIGNYLRIELAKHSNEEQAVYQLLLVIFAMMYGVLLVFFRVLDWSWLFADWMTRKLKIRPSMRLVIIKNDKMWFKI